MGYFHGGLSRSGVQLLTNNHEKLSQSSSLEWWIFIKVHNLCTNRLFYASSSHPCRADKSRAHRDETRQSVESKSKNKVYIGKIILINPYSCWFSDSAFYNTPQHTKTYLASGVRVRRSQRERERITIKTRTQHWEEKIKQQENIDSIIGIRRQSVLIFKRLQWKFNRTVRQQPERSQSISNWKCKNKFLVKDQRDERFTGCDDLWAEGGWLKDKSLLNRERRVKDASFVTSHTCFESIKKSIMTHLALHNQPDSQRDGWIVGKLHIVCLHVYVDSSSACCWRFLTLSLLTLLTGI